MTYSRCIMLLADGSRPDCFAQLLAAGELPHIARYIVEPGAYRAGTTVFPSTTGPAYMPFVTGCFPATCNVPGIRWMDKSRYWDGTARGVRSYVGIATYRINGDMRPEHPTLFELLPKSYNVFNAVNRGVPFWNNRTRLMRIWYWYYAHLTDRWAYLDRMAEANLRAVVDRDFQYCFVVFPGVDEYSHLDDPLGEAARAQYRALDAAVGRTAQRLSRRGILGETLWWIISDHGLSRTHTHCCLNALLAASGRKPLYYPHVLQRGCTAANMMSGNGMTHLYFRHPNGWAMPWQNGELAEHTKTVMERLLAEPAVDLLAVRHTATAVRVLSRRGEAFLEWQGDRLGYRPTTGDPLDVGGALDPLDAETLLQRTMHTTYPDGPYQLAHLFRSARSGDVVVSATPGFDLRLAHERPEHRGSHGSLHREHMLVPILCSHPLTPGPMRTADVFPTTLELMGRQPPPAIDGVSRSEKSV